MPVLTLPLVGQYKGGSPQLEATENAKELGLLRQGFEDLDIKWVIKVGKCNQL